MEERGVRVDSGRWVQGLGKLLAKIPLWPGVPGPVPVVARPQEVAGRGAGGTRHPCRCVQPRTGSGRETGLEASELHNQSVVLSQQLIL